MVAAIAANRLMDSAPRVTTVRTTSIDGPALRLDPKYYQEEFTLAKARVAGCGVPSRLVGELADAFVPGRSKLILTGNRALGAGYLKAHDAFLTRPESSEFVVARRMSDYESYLLKEGTLLTPSSGRNLGPLAYVGKSLAQFAMTDIMRIVPRDRTTGFYLLTFLMTATGQALIRRGRTGTSVDHLSPTDVLEIDVPWFEDDTRTRLSAEMGEAHNVLDDARCTLTALEARLHAEVGLAEEPPSPGYLQADGPRSFSLPASETGARLDVEPYDPRVRACRKVVREVPHATLEDAAELRLLGRYKRYYVQRGFGRPILSGTHLLQLFPVNLRYISDRSFHVPEDFVVRQGWTLFTCDGRAEEGLASPAYVSSLWDGWMASNHVMRAIPKAGVQAGLLYLALRSPYVQLQLKSLAYGSVIDALDPPTVTKVVIPLPGGRTGRELGKAAEEAWEKVAKAVRQITSTVESLEVEIREGYERF
jgi:hypothetical protein